MINNRNSFLAVNCASRTTLPITTGKIQEIEIHIDAARFKINPI